MRKSASFDTARDIPVDTGIQHIHNGCMEMKHVASSAISAIGYDESTSTLKVQMKGSGKVYDYPSVPRDVAHEFINTPHQGSHGKHLAQFIRPKYSAAVKEK